MIERLDCSRSRSNKLFRASFSLRLTSNMGRGRVTWVDRGRPPAVSAWLVPPPRRIIRLVKRQVRERSGRLSLELG